MNINQITVPSLNLVKSVEFYKTLGLKQIVDNLPTYARFECPNGEATFSLHLVESLPAGDGVWVYFECDDLDATVESFVKNGIIFEDQPEDKPWLWREVRLKDPDGNQLILYHAGKNRKNPPWRINPDKTTTEETLDTDLENKDRDELIAEVKKLRGAIRQHRDCTGHNLCWHHPALWALLPEQVEPSITVPDWPEFMAGCVRYRKSLDEQKPDAPRTKDKFIPHQE